VSTTPTRNCTSATLRPANADAAPEGHGIEYDEAGRVVALTLVNVRSLLDRDGEVTITWPAGHVGAVDLWADNPREVSSRRVWF
jgi:hypothetical protein